jgi:hypothetical protein
MRNRARKGIPPTVNYHSPIITNVVRPQPSFRTRFMLVVPRNVQLDAACIKCGCEHGLRYEHGPLTAVQVESLGGTRFPKTIVGYWICRRHFVIARVWRSLGVVSALVAVGFFIAMVSGTLDLVDGPMRYIGGPLLGLSAFFAVMLASPLYRGPLRCWKTRGDRAWLLGAGRRFRARYPHYQP